MDDAAAQLVDDVRELTREVAEFSRRWQRGVTKRFEGVELRRHFFVGRRGKIFGRAKKPDEGAVNRVGGPCEIGVDGNAHVRAVRPVLPVFFVEHVSLRLEPADFGER